MSVLDSSVREFMETDVVTVRPDLPIKDLIEVLEENEITGAPVVDEEENVVGVVSTTDVTRLAAEEEAEGRGGLRRTGAEEDSDYFQYTDRAGGFLPALPPGLPRTRLGSRPVRDIMTRATFSVRPDATLPEAARFLHRAGIHRALVFDDNRLAGLVTTMSIMAALAEDAGR